MSYEYNYKDKVEHCIQVVRIPTAGDKLYHNMRYAVCNKFILFATGPKIEFGFGFLIEHVLRFQTLAKIRMDKYEKLNGFENIG